jgi:hypothetical protein
LGIVELGADELGSKVSTGSTRRILFCAWSIRANGTTPGAAS